MLFWPIVIALGPGFVALFYDHDVRSFGDQSVCGRTLQTREESAANEGIHGRPERSSRERAVRGHFATRLRR